MLSLAFEPAHRVLLARFVGAFTNDDIRRYDRAVLFTIGREGPVRSILDFSAVEGVEVSAPELLLRARQPPILAGQERVLVVTKPALLTMVLTFAALQKAFCGTEPRIVGTLAEAYDLLELREPRFEPIPLS